MLAHPEILDCIAPISLTFRTLSYAEGNFQPLCSYQLPNLIPFPSVAQVLRTRLVILVHVPAVWSAVLGSLMSLKG